MTDTRCQHCRQPMSPLAYACPHCGHPNPARAPAGHHAAVAGAGSTLLGTISGRFVSPLLLLGIVVAPVVFGWALLRNGHSAFSRVMTVLWSLLWLVLVAAAVQAGPLLERLQGGDLFPTLPTPWELFGVEGPSNAPVTKTAPEGYVSPPYLEDDEGPADGINPVATKQAPEGYVSPPFIDDPEDGIRPVVTKTAPPVVEDLSVDGVNPAIRKVNDAEDTDDGKREAEKGTRNTRR